MFLEFWFCLTFSGFPATLLEINFFLFGFPSFLEINGWTQHSCQALSASLPHLLRPNVLVPGQPGAVQSLIHPEKLTAGNQSHGGDFEDDFAFSIG